jgi:hypothetical protein
MLAIGILHQDLGPNRELYGMLASQFNLLGEGLGNFACPVALKVFMMYWFAGLTLSAKHKGSISVKR